MSTSDNATLTITPTPDIQSVLDQALADSATDQTPEMIVSLALREWGVSKGYINAAETGLRPDQLNAANDD